VRLSILKEIDKDLQGFQNLEGLLRWHGLLKNSGYG